MVQSIVEEYLLTKTQEGLPVTFPGSSSHEGKPLIIEMAYGTFCMGSRGVEL